MSKDAEFALVNPENSNERWADFDNYKSTIAYLWLAASDEDEAMRPTMGGTVADRQLLFIKQLFHIGRAHNCEATRTVYDAKGKPKIDEDGEIVTEEFDPFTEGDRPACYSGVNYRLFQGLIDHPLFNPIMYKHVKRDAASYVKAYYKEKLEKMSSKDITKLWNDIHDEDGDLFIPSATPDSVKKLTMSDKDLEVLKEKLAKDSDSESNAFWPQVRKALLGEDKNTFINMYEMSEIGKLLKSSYNKAKLEKPEPTSPAEIGMFAASAAGGKGPKKAKAQKPSPPSGAPSKSK